MQDSHLISFLIGSGGDRNIFDAAPILACLSDYRFVHPEFTKSGLDAAFWCV
jgi:hypothetical protein